MSVSLGPVRVLMIGYCQKCGRSDKLFLAMERLVDSLSLESLCSDCIKDPLTGFGDSPIEWKMLERPLILSFTEDKDEASEWPQVKGGS